MGEGFQGDGLSAMGLCSSWPSPRLPSLLAVWPATSRLTDSRLPDSVHKHEPGLEGRARAGRGRGFSEGGGIGDPGSLSAPIYVAGRTVDSWGGGDRVIVRYAHGVRVLGISIPWHPVTPTPITLSPSCDRPHHGAHLGGLAGGGDD